MANTITEVVLGDFPLVDVQAALEEWWESEKNDSMLPGDEAGATDAGIMKPAIEIDSHRAVRALVTIEEIVKFSIPETEIKEGGYESFEEMKDHLVPRVQALFEKKRNKQHA
jgi:hypothetical protein